VDFPYKSKNENSNAEFNRVLKDSDSGYSERLGCKAREKSIFRLRSGRARGVFADTLSEALERNEAGEPFSTACEDSILNRS